ncbi:MAG: membrane dipeptidase [Phycisphaerales bacterium]
MHWFDAHLDLAYLAENGRDMHAPLSDCRGRFQPPAVTLPSLREGKVTACLGTVFTEAIDAENADSESGPFTYPIGDADAAHRAGMRQLLLYRAWRDAGIIAPMPRRGEAAEASDAPLRLGVLVECADPITEPGELEQWADLGVVAIGMAWWHQSRYAGGNGTDHIQSGKLPGNGLTDLGHELVKRMDELNIVHDLSHLSQRAVDDLLSATAVPVMASHSNCRALMGDPDSSANQRHLSDATIAEITRRGGVIGLNLLGDFVTPGMEKGERAKIADCVRHIEHVCRIAGSRAHIGLGSDMDGGFGADGLPEGINTPADLTIVAEALADAGWNDEEIAGFAHANWDRFWAGD